MPYADETGFDQAFRCALWTVAGLVGALLIIGGVAVWLIL
jgi:hypothetical protein